MLSRLRQHIHSGVLAYRMNKSELIRFADYTAPINAKYAEKLEKLKSDPLLSDVYECIDYMIKNMIRLEQEAMLAQANSQSQSVLQLLG